MILNKNTITINPFQLEYPQDPYKDTNKCSHCGVIPKDEGDCGDFGNPNCPIFGINSEKYKRRNKREYSVDYDKRIT